MLTQRQQQTLDFIAAYKAKREGKSPTFREIKDGLGLNSCGYVGNIIRDLEAFGAITRGDGKSRNIELVRSLSAVAESSPEKFSEVTPA